MRKVVFALLLLVLSSAFFIGCQSPDMTSAKVYIQQKEYDQALASLRREMKNNPTNGEAYFLAGQIYGEMDSLDQMMTTFAKAEELDSQYSVDIKKWRQSKGGQAFNKGIKLWRDKKDLEGSLEWTLIATNIDPDNINAWKNLAFLYQENANRMKEAGIEDSAKIYEDMRLATYELAAKVDPDDEEVLWILAGLYTHQKDMPDKALEILTHRLDKTENPQILSAAADAYDKKGQTDKALEILTKAEALDPENPGLLFDIGVRYYNAKEFDEATQYFEKVVAKEPDNIDAIYNKALCLYNMEKYSEAEVVIKQMVKLDSRNTDAWDQLALIWSKMGKKEIKTVLEIIKALEAGDIGKAQKWAKDIGIDVEIK